MIGTFEQDLLKETSGEIKAYATIAAMRKMGIDPAKYTGDNKYVRCETCDRPYDYPWRWMKEHPIEIVREILEYNRNRK